MPTKQPTAKAKKCRDNYDLAKVEELLRWSYYTGDFVASALVPVAHMSVGSLDQESSGLGDIILGAGYFLPCKQADILPMVFVKFPTGEYRADKAVNIGSNQYDVRPMIFLYKKFRQVQHRRRREIFYPLPEPGHQRFTGK